MTRTLSLGLALVAFPLVLGAQQPAVGSRLVRAAAGAADTAQRAVDVKVERSDQALRLTREVYRYDSGGRRDPFVSLMSDGELRPMISDLRLVAIAYASDGGSVAILRDLGTNEQYRVRTGQTLGRMRVARIGPKQVTFTIEEFGFSRQETLALGDSNSARTQQ